MTQILTYLTEHGPRLDAEIAKDTGIPLEAVRKQVAGLRATGDIVTSDLTRFEAGKPIPSWICSVPGYTPPDERSRVST